VYLALDQSNHPVAIKRVQLTPQNVDQIATEVGIMKECIHPHIVQYIDCFMMQVCCVFFVCFLCVFCVCYVVVIYYCMLVL
jgi:serine/threonine protein kinase